MRIKTNNVRKGQTVEKGIEFNKRRLKKAIEEFSDRESVYINNREFLDRVLGMSLDCEIDRNKKEYKRRYDQTFSNFAIRNKAYGIEKQGEKVEFEIIEYFRRLNVAASRFDISEDNPLILKTADGEVIDDVVMPSLYRIEIGDEIPTKAGYYSLSEDMKKIIPVYTEDKLTEFYFTNILDEEESYSYSPTLVIKPSGLSSDISEQNDTASRKPVRRDFHRSVNLKPVSHESGEHVLFSALNNYNAIKREDKPEFLNFMFPENYDHYDIDKLIDLGNEELSCHKLITCKTCGNVFSMTQGEIRHFTEELKLVLPKRCPSCRYIRKNCSS